MIRDPSADLSDADARRIASEMRRQVRVLGDEAPVRLVAVPLAYVICALFVPVWLVAVCAAVDALAEGVTSWLHRRPERLRPGRIEYRVYLAMVVLAESSFTLPAALLWHADADPYLKALSVGIICAALMHVATVRSIHLPLGALGMAAIAAVAAGSNTAYWLPQGNLAEWAFSTFCLVLGVGYFAGAMRSNHRMHRETAEGELRAQEADAAKGRFLAQISHELRTPLNAILGLGRAALSDAADAATRSRMALLVRSGEGLATLLDDVLDMAAVEAGRLPIRPAPTVPAQEITATVALWRPVIEAAGQHLTVDLDPALELPALIDAQRLRQCLSNLLSNAARHAGPTEVTLRARCIRPAGAEPVLRVEVADRGAGLDPGVRMRLFAPFERGATNLDSPDRPGSGLGLTISRALARQMRGDLWLMPAGPDSPGVTFALSLPLPPVAVPAAAADAVPAPAPLPPGLRVLVVDDIATNRLVAATYLRRLGADPVEAESGQQALERVAAGGVDMVLLDMNMPGMDGAATLRALRRLQGPGGRLPVVAMTADTLDGARDRHLALGMDGFVAKPVSPALLAAELGRLVPGRGAGGE